jgi:hypothetical protein
MRHILVALVVCGILFTPSFGLLWSKQSIRIIVQGIGKLKNFSESRFKTNQGSQSVLNSAIGINKEPHTVIKPDEGQKVKPKDLLQKYGPAYLATSITLAIISYATCYLLISTGVDVIALLEKLGIKSTVTALNTGTATIAYAVHKATSPIRFPPTVALTPMVAGWFGKKTVEVKK